MLIRGCFRAVGCAALVQLFTSLPGTAMGALPAQHGPVETVATIAWDQIGAKAGSDYHGEGLWVAASGDGARLHCAFQRLEGEATAEGLWLLSTVTNQPADRFRVVAMAVGRQGVAGTSKPQAPASSLQLSQAGKVSVAGQTVRFVRAGLMEEYSVSVDGIRQDFLVTEKPAGEGPLKVQLDVSGARVEPTAYGAQLVLEKSGRRIAYSRLRATDATGKGLPACIKAASLSALRTPHSALELVVDDAGAVYPLRIDPTFSDANWISLGGVSGVNGEVYATVVDGSGNLYVGGNFGIAGNVAANAIAEWNGSSWSALGSGLVGTTSPTYVYALAVSGNTLYAGGTFTNAGGVAASSIAKWDGTTWSALGSGIGLYGRSGGGNTVKALALSGSDLYAGGSFTNAGSVSANYVAKWDGSSWSAVGSGMSSGVSALAVSGNTLYAGGAFTMAGGTNANYIAKWDGTNWLAMGSGMNGSVNALAVSGNTLYAGGAFTTAGGSNAQDIAQWNGTNWSAVGSGMGGGVYSLAVSGNTLYAGGNFADTANFTNVNYIAKWNGSTWSALGSGMNGSVNALAVSGNTVFAGGLFVEAGGTPAAYVAQWSGSAWSSLGAGMDGLTSSAVRALAVSGNTLYAGGNIMTAGGGSASHVIQWNGSSWTAVGSGLGNVNDIVYALAVSGDSLYAGGTFTTAGGTNAAHIAQWNGTNWLALGSGLNSYVYALAVSGNTLYAGGQFGGYLSQWNGTNWSALGSGVNYYVQALAVSGNTLYAGGQFTTAGGTNAAHIAQWNGTNWSALGSGMAGGGTVSVYALAMSGNTLYAGGNFGAAGGSNALYIAQWNGTNWSALGSGMNGVVNALAVSGSTLYVGGAFTNAGGVSASAIAQWDGNNWSALGSGLNDPVSALAVSGDALYAGGGFTKAGGRVSAYAAEASLLALPVTLSVPMRLSSSQFQMLLNGISNQNYTLEMSTNLGATNWVALYVTNNPASNSFLLTDPNATNQQRFYRVLVGP